jgi:hypothetical protein
MNKTLRKYGKLDRLSPDGTFTVSSKKNLDMLGIRNYCMSTGKKCDKLTETEIKRFER